MTTATITEEPSEATSETVAQEHAEPELQEQAQSEPKTEQTAYVIEATTARVVASGEKFQIILETSGEDWLRYVTSKLHKGSNTIIIRPHQARWEPPAQSPAKRIECGYDEELDKYRCKDQADALAEPCEHYLAMLATEEAAADEQDVECPNPECVAPFTAAQQRGEQLHECDFSAALEGLGLPAKNGRRKRKADQATEPALVGA